MEKEQIRAVLQQEKIICDGAFGTYYATKYDTQELPEFANVQYPERVIQIHREYIESGAVLIRTNTYASNSVALRAQMETVKENIRNGYAHALKAVEVAAKSPQTINREKKRFVAADIGPISYESVEQQEAVQKEYVEICETFLEEGTEIFLFETFSSMADIEPAITAIGDRAFIIVQFSVNQFGYSNAGLSARKLIKEAQDCKAVDATGFNCGIGPGHMHQMLRGLERTRDIFFTALPNAGYPQHVRNRMIFSNQNEEYFASKVADIAAEGADIVGGCCGTTPDYIRRVCEKVNLRQESSIVGEKKEQVLKPLVERNAFYEKKGAKKLIAVELAPPLGSDDGKLMDAAHLLQKSGVDVLTFPDSPSGRTRADAILMAEKVSRETGMCVMPHICCRDKNAIAMRSQLLGAHINEIYNFLVITGDPIPSMVRSEVKSVFNFDSVGLMRIMNDMNEDQFQNKPISYGGAINQGRRNLVVEIGRVKKKMEAGATFFLTQPVASKESAERIRRIKEETGARILCGIMPFVSLKNALFMKNEMTGIDVSTEVLSRYRENMTRTEGEAVGVALAREMIALTQDFSDGYYFSFPFNRVYLLERILAD